MKEFRLLLIFANTISFLLCVERVTHFVFREPNLGQAIIFVILAIINAIPIDRFISEQIKKIKKRDKV